MILSYVLVSTFLFVFNVVQSVPYREKYALSQVPIEVEKPIKIKVPEIPINSDEKASERPVEEDAEPTEVTKDGDTNIENIDAVDDDGKEHQKLKNDEKQAAGTSPGSDAGSEHDIIEAEAGEVEKVNDDKEEPPRGEHDIIEEEVSGEVQKANGDNEDNINSAEDLKLHHKQQQQQGNMAFKKYHAEKVTNLRDTMASNWPLGIIPYHIDTSSFDDILADRVRDAMDFLESASCVQFKAISGKTPSNYAWIHITNPEKQRECSHQPRRKRSGEIVLVLGLDCLRRRDILHSLLHAIGFNDEVTHPNRDQYIRIMWENLQPRFQRLFSIIPGEQKVMVEYDPMSIMHFHDRAFSKNGQATIVPLMPGLQIQPSEKLSQLDKMKLRLAFGHECNRRTVDDLFDTCKTVMHNGSGGKDLKSKGSNVKLTFKKNENNNNTPSKKISENEVGNDNDKNAQDDKNNNSDKNDSRDDDEEPEAKIV